MSELGLSGSATKHTLRHTAVTYLKEMGFSAAAIDRFLSKTVREGSASHSIYNDSVDLDEKSAVAEGSLKTPLSLSFGATNEWKSNSYSDYFSKTPSLVRVIEKI